MTARATPRPSPEIPRPAAVYGAAGVVPFAAGTLGVWIAPPGWDNFALNLLLFYGATIISFLGAVHWGLALAGVGRDGDGQDACNWTRLGWSVAPALIAWLSLVMVPLVGLVTQIGAVAVLHFADLHATRLGLAPPWYPRLRRPLSMIVIVCLGAALLRVIWSG